MAYVTAFAAHSYAFSLAMDPEISEPPQKQTEATQTPKKEEEEEGDLDVQGGNAMGFFCPKIGPNSGQK